MLESLGGSVDQQVGVMIVGAGPAGLCHALWLRQFDVEVLVIDSDQRSHRDEWVVLGPDAFRVLSRVGVQNELGSSRLDYDAIVLVPPRGAHDDRASERGPHLLRLPASAREQAPLALVNRAALEATLERRAREVGAQVERGQRLQRVEIRPTHCEARVVAAAERAVPHPTQHPAVTPRDSARRLLVQWLIGTDGYHSVVRRDLRAQFRPIAEPRTASIIRLAGRRSVDVEGAVQVTVSKRAVHTLWPLGADQLLWVTQTTGDDVPSGLEIDPESPLALSNDGIQYGTVTDAFVEQQAPRLGIQVDGVLHRHAIHYRPSAADPLGRGRAWTSGSAAQVIAPELGFDDNLGLLEVPDLALLLGFGVEDGMSGLATLTPRLYHERRARAQQHVLGAQPLGTKALGLREWSSHDREVIASAFPFLAPVGTSGRSVGSAARSIDQPHG